MKNTYSLYMLTLEELAKLTGQNKKQLSAIFPNNTLQKLPSGKWAVPPSQVQEYLGASWIDYSFKAVACINLKGGTGKTISTITAATRATQFGFKTCIVDMDAQANATHAFGIHLEDDDPVFCDVWKKPEEMVMGALRKICEYLYILPSSLENSLMDVSLANPNSQKSAVDEVCRILKRNGFDLVLIDCPPSLGTAVISTICAADILVIPICGDTFSIKGLEYTLKETDAICETFNLNPPLTKILFTQYDRRTALSDYYLKQVTNDHPDKIFPFSIRISSLFPKSLKDNKTVFASTGKNRARDDYDRFVKQLLQLENFS